MNYSEAYLKLEELVKQLEEGDIPLEELTQKVKLANELIAVCEKKLRDIDREITDATGDSAI